MTFKVTHQDGSARIGELTTAHGTIETPFFMPVLTKGTGKLITTDDYNQQKTEAIIANALLLSLRPGTETIQKADGLHKFINFQNIIFTDCGGFQMSRTIFETKSKRGLHFRNPYHHNKIILTPKKIMEIQLQIGSDVAMMLDDMSGYGVSEEQARIAMENTHRWGKESLEWHNKLKQKYDSKQLLFGIVQGNFFPELRKKSAKYLTRLDFDGFAIGGVAIGEPKDEMNLAVDNVLPFLPKDKPRYVMGVGSPLEVLDLISKGIDCFDSVYPTQVARHHTIFTRTGKINIDQNKYSNDFKKIEDDCTCHTCQNYTRAYLYHLAKIKEPAGKRLRSIHNTYFMQRLINEARDKIKSGQLSDYIFNFRKNWE